MAALLGAAPGALSSARCPVGEGVRSPGALGRGQTVWETVVRGAGSKSGTWQVGEKTSLQDLEGLLWAAVAEGTASPAGSLGKVRSTEEKKAPTGRGSDFLTPGDDSSGCFRKVVLRGKEPLVMATTGRLLASRGPRPGMLLKVHPEGTGQSSVLPPCHRPESEDPALEEMATTMC